MTDWVQALGASRVRQPGPRLLESCWRVRTSKGRVVACGIYQDDGAPGVEVRAGFSEDDLARSQRVADITQARAVAAEWRQALIDKGLQEVTTS